MTLDQLPVGGVGVVSRLTGAPNLVQRFYEIGLFEGETVEVVSLAPLGDPVEVRLGATRLTLRRSEAAAVELQDG